MPAGNVEIHISLTDGSVHRFRQDDYNAFARFLVHLQPAKVFGNPQIIIGSAKSVHGFHSTQVERIDLLVDSLPDYWTMPPHLVQTEEITRSEFESIVGLSPGGNMPPMAAKEGEIGQNYAEFELTSGARAYVRFHVRLRAAIEQKNTIQHLLVSGAIWFRRADRGYALLNVANMGRFSLFPGPPNLPATAWPMEKI